MRCLLLLLFLLTVLPSVSLAQFGLILPADDMVSQREHSRLDLQIRLYDPSNPSFLELALPRRFGVQQGGEQTDLLDSLKPDAASAPTIWRNEFVAEHPGDGTFYAEFAPRWDAAEDQFRIHRAKLCVNFSGVEESWDEPVGLDAEILPLSRPYGLWTGNLFSGQVLLDGEPAPYAAIEVAWLGSSPHEPPAAPVPAAAYRIQKIRSDANGVFHYAMPRPGWWGFAAILDADWTLKRGDEEKAVAIVTSYWVLTRDLR